MKKLSPATLRLRPFKRPPPVEVSISIPGSIHRNEPGSARSASPGASATLTYWKSSPSTVQSNALEPMLASVRRVPFLRALASVFTVRALLTAPLLLALACRAPAAEETSVDPLLAVVRAQEAAWNTGSVEAFMAAGYWQSNELTFLSGGDWNRGYDNVLTRYSARYTAGEAEMGHLTFAELEAERYSRRPRARARALEARFRLGRGPVGPVHAGHAAPARGLAHRARPHEPRRAGRRRKLSRL